jgi:hypothetical protein
MSPRRVLLLACLLPLPWVPGLLASVQAADLAAPPDLRQAAPSPSPGASAAPQPAPAPAAASRPVAQAASTPQAVVIQDKYTRIEELHEHGEVRSIKVQPKGARAYEIVPATGGRDMSNSAGNGRGAAGQRVWPILSF